MTTPHDAEGDSREAVLRADLGVRIATDALGIHWSDGRIGNVFNQCADPRGDLAQVFDAYRAAVYARAMRDAVGVVAAYRTTHGAHNCTLCASDLVCHDAAADYVHNAVLDAVTTRLAALPATPSREGAR